MKMQNIKTYGMHLKQYLKRNLCYKYLESSQITNQTFHLKIMKKEQTKQKARRKKIIKIPAGRNKIENRKTQKINETKIFL